MCIVLHCWVICFYSPYAEHFVKPDQKADYLYCIIIYLCGQRNSQTEPYDGHAKGDNGFVLDDPVCPDLVNDGRRQRLQQAELQVRQTQRVKTELEVLQTHGVKTELQHGKHMESTTNYKYGKHMESEQYGRSTVKVR